MNRSSRRGSPAHPPPPPPPPPHEPATPSLAKLRLVLRLGPAPRDLQPVELCFHSTWRPCCRRRIRLHFVEFSPNLLDGEWIPQHVDDIDGNGSLEDEVEKEGGGTCRNLGQFDHDCNQDYHNTFNDDDDDLTEHDEDGDDAPLTSITHSWKAWNGDGADNPDRPPCLTLHLPDPIDLTMSPASSSPPACPSSSPPPPPSPILRRTWGPPRGAVAVSLAVLVALLGWVSMLRRPTPLALLPRRYKVDYVGALEVMTNNYISTLPALLSPVTSSPDPSQPAWLPRRLVTQLRREMGNACSSITGIQRARSRSSSSSSSSSRATSPPPQDVEGACEQAIHHLEKAQRLLDDSTSELLSNDPLLFYFRTTLGVLYVRLDHDLPPFLDNSSTSRPGQRNSTADWFGDEVRQNLRFWEGHHHQLALPITQCLEHLLAAAELEKAAILPFLNAIVTHPLTGSRFILQMTENIKISVRILTSYLLPRRDLLLGLLQDSSEHLARAQVELDTLKASLETLYESNWHAPVTIFKQTGSHITCSGDVHLDMGTEETVPVMWYFEDAKDDILKLSNEIAAAVEATTDHLTRFLLEQPRDESPRDWLLEDM
ncbi:hypothetical protein LY76DRAFT_598757 [Colletotrichum caudatum]|nr:hypothetical protein LY76DRAFT_598757 [Colletotrichum caudatum]